MKRLIIIILIIFILLVSYDKETTNYTEPTISYITDSGFHFTHATLSLGQTLKDEKK